MKNYERTRRLILRVQTSPNEHRRIRSVSVFLVDMFIKEKTFGAVLKNLYCYLLLVAKCLSVKWKIRIRLPNTTIGSFWKETLIHFNKHIIIQKQIQCNSAIYIVWYCIIKSRHKSWYFIPIGRKSIIERRKALVRDRSCLISLNGLTLVNTFSLSRDIRKTRPSLKSTLFYTLNGHNTNIYI